MNASVSIENTARKNEMEKGKNKKNYDNRYLLADVYLHVHDNGDDCDNEQQNSIEKTRNLRKKCEDLISTSTSTAINNEWDGPKGQAFDMVKNSPSDVMDSLQGWRSAGIDTDSSNLYDEIIRALNRSNKAAEAAVAAAANKPKNIISKDRETNKPSKQKQIREEKTAVTSAPPPPLKDPKKSKKSKSKMIVTNKDITIHSVPLVLIQLLYNMVTQSSIASTGSDGSLTVDSAGKWFLQFYQNLLQRIGENRLEGTVEGLEALAQILNNAYHDSDSDSEVVHLPEALQMSMITRALATAQAMKGNLNEALTTLNTLVEMVGSKDIDARERRAEVAVALQQNDIAFADLQVIIEHFEAQVKDTDLVSPQNLLSAIMKQAALLVMSDQPLMIKRAHKDLLIVLQQVLMHRLSNADDPRDAGPDADIKRNQFIAAFEADPSRASADLLTETLLSHTQKVRNKLLFREDRLYLLLGKCEKAFGNLESAISFYTMALTLCENMNDLRGTHEALHHRALAYTTISDIDSAKLDMKKVLREDPKNMGTWGIQALMYQNLGHCEETITSFEKVLQLEGSVHVEVSPHLLMAACYRSLGQYASSLNSIRILHELELRTGAAHGSEWKEEILAFEYSTQDDDFSTFSIDLSLSAAVKLKSIYVQQGGPGNSKVIFESQKKKLQTYLQTLRGLSFDTSKFQDTQNLDLTHYRDRVKKAGGFLLDQSRQSEVSRIVTNALPILKKIKGLSRLVQIQSPGFLPNKLQHKQFALAVAHMSVRINQHVQLIIAAPEGGEESKNKGYLVHNDAASSVTSKGFQVLPEESSYHVFYWRDLYDIGVRYRHLSAPLDQVFWTDGLFVDTRGDSNNGSNDGNNQESQSFIGMTTHIVAGLDKVVRYYNQFGKALQLVKDCILSHGYFNVDKKLVQIKSKSKQAKQIASAKTLLQLINATSGGKNFYIVTKLQSQFQSQSHKQTQEGDDDDDEDNNDDNDDNDDDGNKTASYLPGTMFFVIKEEVDYSFSLCLPSSPTRFTDFENEMNEAFISMTAALTKYRHFLDSNGGRMENDYDDDEQIEYEIMQQQLQKQVVRQAYTMFFYWANFGPLTRGTSAVGYAVLVATLASVGLEPVAQLPEDVQLDWEAFYSSSPREFITRAEKYLQLQPVTHAMPADLSRDDDLVSLIESASTTRAVKEILNRAW